MADQHENSERGVHEAATGVPPAPDIPAVRRETRLVDWECARRWDERLVAAGLADVTEFSEAQIEQVGSILAESLDLKLGADAHRVLGQAVSQIQRALLSVRATIERAADKASEGHA